MKHMELRNVGPRKPTLKLAETKQNATEWGVSAQVAEKLRGTAALLIGCHGRCDARAHDVKVGAGQAQAHGAVLARRNHAGLRAAFCSVLSCFLLSVALSDSAFCFFTILFFLLFCFSRVSLSCLFLLCRLSLWTQAAFFVRALCVASGLQHSCCNLSFGRAWGAGRCLLPRCSFCGRWCELESGALTRRAWRVMLQCQLAEVTAGQCVLAHALLALERRGLGRCTTNKASRIIFERFF